MNLLEYSLLLWYNINCNFAERSLLQNSFRIGDMYYASKKMTDNAQSKTAEKEKYKTNSRDNRLGIQNHSNRCMNMRQLFYWDLLKWSAPELASISSALGIMRAVNNGL